MKILLIAVVLLLSGCATLDDADTSTHYHVGTFVTQPTGAGAPMPTFGTYTYSTENY